MKTNSLNWKFAEKNQSRNIKIQIYSFKNWYKQTEGHRFLDDPRDWLVMQINTIKRIIISLPLEFPCPNSLPGSPLRATLKGMIVWSAEVTISAGSSLYSCQFRASALVVHVWTAKWTTHVMHLRAYIKYSLVSLTRHKMNNLRYYQLIMIMSSTRLYLREIFLALKI